MSLGHFVTANSIANIRHIKLFLNVRSSTGKPPLPCKKKTGQSGNLLKWCDPINNTTRKEESFRIQISIINATWTWGKEEATYKAVAQVAAGSESSRQQQPKKRSANVRDQGEEKRSNYDDMSSKAWLGSPCCWCLLLLFSSFSRISHPPNNIAWVFFMLLLLLYLSIECLCICLVCPILVEETFNSMAKEGRKQSRLDLLLLRPRGNRILNWQHGNIPKIAKKGGNWYKRTCGLIIHRDIS
jgi:hypothetical protein